MSSLVSDFYSSALVLKKKKKFKILFILCKSFNLTMRKNLSFCSTYKYIKEVKKRICMFKYVLYIYIKFYINC